MNTSLFTNEYETQYTTNDYLKSDFNASTPSSGYFLNSTLDITNNTNPQHFPIQAIERDLYSTILYVVILVASTIPVSMVLCVLVYFSLNYVIKKVRQCTPKDDFRPEVLSVIHGASDHSFYQNNDEMQMLDVASSVYPADQLLNCCGENSINEKMCTDTVTTPLSNNSIITMTMRNNHLIVETEERIPVNLSCSISNPEDLYPNSYRTLPNAYGRHEIENSMSNYLLDDLDDYSIDHCQNNEERGFFEATTSHPIEEDDQHIDVFHKNIFVIPSNHEHESDIAPSCSYNYTNLSSPFYGAVSTGYSQSDLTGSSSSTSRQVQVDYCYGNQCEYMPTEYPLRKRTLNRTENYDKPDVLIALPSPSTNRSPENSVLLVNDCSSNKCFESSEE